MKQKQKNVKLEQDKKHLVKKSKDKGEHKEQGTTAPAMHLKNGGDAFAYGITSIMVEAQKLKGSQKAWLGVESEMLDPSEYIKRDKLNVKK